MLNIYSKDERNATPLKQHSSTVACTKIFLLLFICCFSFGKVFAQRDSIIINKDSRLDIIKQKQNLINKRSALMTSSGLYRGYRLQVLTTNNRTQAFQLKTNLLSLYPDQKVYILFQSPYFKVRFGNYLKRDEAEKMRKQLSRQYTQAIFIVEDSVEYTPVGDEDIK